MRRLNKMAGLVLAGWAAGWAGFAQAQPAVPGLPEIRTGSAIPPRASMPPLPQINPTPAADAGGAVPPADEIGSRPAPVPAREAAPGVPGSPVPASDPASGSAPEEEREMPTGRHESGISLEWVGPTVSKVGQPADYSLAVRNLSAGALGQVSVHAQLPAGLSVQGSMPQARQEGGLLTWDLGTMQGKQTHTLRLKLRADAKGDAGPKAWATCRTGSASMRLSVREPKLALKCSAPDRVLVGDPTAMTITVTNPGDGASDHIRVRATLSAGLEAASGHKTEFDIGTLAAGESRNVTLLCTSRAGGAQKCEVTAEADGGLTAQAAAAMTVVMPRLDLHVSGPRLRYLDRRGVYTLKVGNSGDAPALNVTVTDVMPAGLKVVAASDGGGYDFQTRTVSWFLGGMAPGQTREVQVEVQAVTVGDYTQKAAVTGAGNVRVEGEATTRVEAVSALLVEVVDTEDPVEVGGETAYEVMVTNSGSTTETDVRLVAVVPEGLEFKGAAGPEGPAKFRAENGTVVFDPLPKLAPQAVAKFRVSVKATTAGTRRFRAEVTSTNLTEPMVRMEFTRVYGDAPGAPAPVRTADKPAAPSVPAPTILTPSEPRPPAPTPEATPAVSPAPSVAPAAPPAPSLNPAPAIPPLPSVPPVPSGM